MHARIVACTALLSIYRTAYSSGAEGRYFDGTNGPAGALQVVSPVPCGAGSPAGLLAGGVLSGDAVQVHGSQSAQQVALQQ
jgi:hypothetical protein